MSLRKRNEGGVICLVCWGLWVDTGILVDYASYFFMWRVIYGGDFFSRHGEGHRNNIGPC